MGTLSDRDIQGLFEAGRYADLIRLTQFSARTAQRYEPQARAFLTQALSWCGDFEIAADIARSEATNPSPSVRSQAETVLGFAATAKGELVDAIHHHQAAVRFAKDCGARDILAWSMLYLFRSLIEAPGRPNAMSLLPAVREAVTSAGNAQATAYLHACVAILEGEAGHLDEARRHCTIAESLLKVAPNARIAALANLNAACVAILRGEFVDAERYCWAAKKDVENSGHTNAETALDGNLAHIALFTGKWERAQREFRRALGSDTHWRCWRPSGLEGLARLHLALGDLEASESALKNLDELVAKHPVLAQSYAVRWAAVTKVRLLWKSSQAIEATRHVDHALSRAEEVGDLPLVATLRLCRAVAKRLVHDLAASADSICSAENAGSSRIPETQPQHYFACAQVVSGLDPELSAVLSRRATEIWIQQRVVSVQREMEVDTLNVPTAKPDQGVASVPQVLNSLGALSDLARFPEIFERELGRIIRGLDLSPRVEHVQRPTPARRRSAPSSTLTLSVEARHGMLSCEAPSDPVKAVLLADVLRIGRAAVELERYRQEERARAALWPADPIETEAGALFLAEEMQALLATARRVAPTTVPILVTGETGTGKEVLARLIHAYSTRAKATFLPFNCSATPKDMLDSQLFGHRRGAFTGATDSFPGVIRAAAGGTLLLDEIGELTPDVQPKLLRFLESGEVHPLGETHPGKVDVRIVAATNADLDALVSAGRFREDLFYRLNIVRLHLPPLRERRVEIPALANHYLRKHARENGKGDLRLAEETMEYLVLFRWPGNVRQLANEMRRLAALAESDAVLMPEHLSADIFASRKTLPASERTLEPTELVVRLDQPMAAAVQHVERAMIVYAMQKCGGGMEDTASRLGLSRKGLYLKRQRYAIETPGEDAAAVA